MLLKGDTVSPEAFFFQCLYNQTFKVHLFCGFSLAGQGFIYHVYFYFFRCLMLNVIILLSLILGCY